MLDLKSYYSSPAFQLGLLVAYAKLEEEVKKNVEFTFTEHPREQPAEEIAEEIFKVGADLVTASNYAWNYKKICQTIEILTNSDRKLPRILLGGPNSAGEFGAEMMKRYPIISAMVEAEGEPAFRDICSSLVDTPDKDPFINSRNCVVRAENGDIVRPNMNHRLEYLDEVPSPYLTGILPVKPDPIFYETNRGCPYRCSFCYWGNGNSKVYRMSHDRIYEEMEFFAKNKVMAFWIADANFGIFPDDSEIAELMVEVNSRYGYPFKHIGVNWAKNSSDRVLEIASMLKSGRMSCTTTLALQSVTAEAEEKSRRYSMAPSKFVNLISAAAEKNLDTYTDIMWGLAGESVEEYLDGIDCVVSTGVPSIKIHQLYLLPGTEFYDERKKFGFKMLSDMGVTEVDPNERHDYWDYLVVSHPKMSLEEMRRGTRIMGINHLLHNHDLGKVVDFYLTRYDVSHRDVYNFFDELLLGNLEDFPEEKHQFLADIRELILTFSTNIGLDEFVFYRKLSELVWFRKSTKLGKESNEPAVRAFMHDFYRALCRKHNICQTPNEQKILADFVDYNVLISPKPAWRPEASYSFKYDVHAIWHDVQRQIHSSNRKSNGAIGSTNGKNSGKKKKQDEESWDVISKNLRDRLTRLLSDEYLESKRQSVSYTFKNPWAIVPSQDTGPDWLITNHSKHCKVEQVTADSNSEMVVAHS